MPEQLTMDFDNLEAPHLSDLSPNLPPENDEPITYEALDYQLAELLQSLNDKPNTVLEHCTLQISKQTREGQIAIACTQEQQAELFATLVVGKAGEYKPLIIDKGYLYLNRYWHYQQQLAELIQARMVKVEEAGAENTWLKDRLRHYFGEADSSETDWQKLAAQRALQNNFLILSGGPGTGKTTTITRILALLIEQHQAKEKVDTKTKSPLRIMLAAPTGKAAIRMLDSIRNEQQQLSLDEQVVAQMPNHASTLHKLLGFIPQSVTFKHNRQNPLNADIVLIDEASMVDIALMSKLVEAVPPQAKLILIGDKDQLASVETGSVFADMCEGLSEQGETENNQHIVTLQKNWRFAKESGIGQLAIATNAGDSATVLAILTDQIKTENKTKNKAECTLLSPELISQNKLPADLITPWQHYFEVLNNPEANIADIFDAFNQYRILCALRRGLNGSSLMSNRIEEALSQQGLINRQIQNNTSAWYHGRPVMITQNSYSKGLFNGDTGITLIDKSGQASVWFPDSSVQSDSNSNQNNNENNDHDSKAAYKSIAPVRLPAHETTWAMTIHKSQGSEFNQVTLILPHEVMPLLTRQLIYTGVTRAKEQVSVVASEDVLAAGVKAEVVKATRIAHLFS